MMKQKGLVVSIDFELNWGYSNVNKPLEERQVAEGLHTLIALFEKYQIKTTWAIVGQLIEKSEKDVDTLFHRPHWIRQVLQKHPLVEIASHTYEHLFVEEATIANFEKDTQAMKKTMTTNEVAITSIVFPRNQYKSSHIKILKTQGYTHFRTVLRTWFLKTNKYSEEQRVKKYIKRIFELVPFKRDVEIVKKEGLTAVSDSRFFRFFPNTFIGRFLSKYYHSVLCYEMKQCFKRNNLYHIWFHPHNCFTKPTSFKALEQFLIAYKNTEKEASSFKSYFISEIHCL